MLNILMLKNITDVEVHVKGKSWPIANRPQIANLPHNGLEEFYEDLHHVAMRQDGSRVPLHDLEVPSMKAGAVFGGRYKVARLADQPIGIGSGGGLLGIQGLVDAYNELRKVMEPGEPWVTEHQAEILSGRCDAGHIPLVSGSLGIEQTLVQTEQSVSQLGQAFTGAIGHSVHRTVDDLRQNRRA